MNPLWLYKNIRHANSICCSRGDMIRYLRVLYSDKFPYRNLPVKIKFRFADPVCRVNVLLRSTADNFILGEVFDHKYYDCSLGFVPKSILDLGGHIGLSSIFFAKKFPDASIVCLEPEPGNAEILRNNFKLNNVKAEFINAAIAVEDGEVIIEINSKDYGHQVVDQAIANGEHSLTVPAISVRSIMDMMGWPSIDLVKMDIEGYEASLMTCNADWMGNVRAIMMEVHPPFNLMMLRDEAVKHGFKKVEQLNGCVLVTR